jgi:hypothetical protein
MAYLNANCPYIPCYLKNEFLYDENVGEGKGSGEYTLCEIFAVTSLTRRCLTFSIMTEYGTQHARVPIHYIVNEKDHSNLPLDFLQLWDNFSPNISVAVHEYTKNSLVKVQLKDKRWVWGKYLFTIDYNCSPEHPFGYSEMAGGHKCAHLIWGTEFVEDKKPVNQLFAQPNNRVVWYDGGAFISSPLSKKPDWQVFTKEFTCEKESKYTTEDNFDSWYEFKKD